MKTKMKYAIPFLLVIIPATAWSQPQSDPYAKDVQNQQIANYVVYQHQVIGQIRFVYFAQGCGVFLNNNGAFQAQTYLLIPLDQEAIKLVPLNAQNAIAINHQMADAAGKEGLGWAKEPNRCDWFKEHPEAVNELRAGVGRL